MTTDQLRVLILGGTAEARTLAERLHGRGVPVISSLAGRVSRPRLPVGAVRIGGFGGVHGLAEYIAAEHITHVIDATHPFATTMTAHGLAAATSTGTPFVRYARPGWRERPDAGSWHWAHSYAEARDLADGLGRRPFLTTGRQTLEHFTEPWSQREVLVRVVEPLGDQAPARWRVLLDRGPYTLPGELQLLRTHGVDVLLTKDSGGSYTAAKLDAAAELEVPVVVLARPDLPSGAVELTRLEDAVAAVLGPAPGQ